jgi:hypothetical protein
MLAVSDQFPTMEDARKAMHRHVLDEGESYKVYRSDRSRHILICKDSTCKFRLRASLLKKKGAVITILIPHSCSPANHYKNKQSSAMWFLKDHHRASLVDNRALTPAQIQSNERLRFGNTISYRQAHRLKQALLDEIEGQEADCFAQFPAYMKRLEASDPDNQSALVIDSTDGSFQAAAFAPAAMKKAFRWIRKFVALDACHTRSKFRMMLMIAVGIDANDNILPLSWALVPTENDEWWTWYCKFLKDCFPAMDNQGVVFISDRDKGLAASVHMVFPNATPAHCCQHIADNVQQRYGVKCRPLFWRCAWAKTRQLFEEALAALQAEDGAAAAYVDNISHGTWARYAFPYPRFGHNTSNNVESLNSVWNPLRSLSPLKMVDAIWSTTMKTIYDRSHRPQQSTEIADIPLLKFKDRLRSSHRYRVFESGNGVYQVQVPDSGSKFIVNLAQRTCTCMNFQEYVGPCTHAITACRFEAEDPYVYFYWAYRMRSYRKTYQNPMIPVSIEDLASDSRIYPPKLGKLRGRPKTKRIRRGAWNRQPRQCRNCKQTGHNIRSCTGIPMPKNGRGERARDWQAIEVDEDSSSDVIVVDIRG